MDGLRNGAATSAGATSRLTRERDRVSSATSGGGGQERMRSSMADNRDRERVGASTRTSRMDPMRQSAATARSQAQDGLPSSMSGAQSAAGRSSAAVNGVGPSSHRGTAAASADAAIEPRPPSSSTDLEDGIRDIQLAPPPLSDKGKSRAQFLSEWRSRRGQSPLSSEILLRDMLYLLQGIDGTHVRFSFKTQAQREREANPYLVEPDFNSWGLGHSKSQQRQQMIKGKEKERLSVWDQDEEITGLIFADENGKTYTISPSLRTTIVQLAELGMLYRRILAFVRSTEAHAGSAGTAHASSQTSMTQQSLCHFLQRELSDYHQLLTTLELQMAKDAADPPPVASSSTLDPELIFGSVPVEESRMTFQKLSLWAEDVALKMRMMNALVDDARAHRGGALLSAIHAHTSHGDPFIQQFTDRILREVSKPFFATLQQWIFSGQLQDPFNEFFVQINADQRTLGRHTPMGDTGFGGMSNGMDQTNIAYMLWEKQYVFVRAMLPRFINVEFGRKIFSTGKSINFIRYSCRDSEWSTIQAQLEQVDSELKHSDIPRLERTIDGAYGIASARLLEIFFEKYKLLDHLQAMKRYILLCEGDFADVLLEQIGPRLDREATKLLRHHLTQNIEEAIQQTNARHESFDILRRLDARITPPQPGDLGWDCFALEYRVEAPINAVLDGKAMVEYDELFQHFWRVRRVHRALLKGWHRLLQPPRKVKQLPTYRRLFHRAQILQAQMVHFITQIESFCSLEAIELAWQDLLEFANARQGDLDALIAAHRAFLKKIVGRALLIGKDKDDSLLRVLREALNLIMTFANIAESLFHVAMAEGLRLDRQLDVERGIISANSHRDDPAQTARDAMNVEEQLNRCADSFRAQVAELVYGLEANPNYEVKFLAVRLSFNEHYSMRKSTRSNKLASKSRTTMHDGTMATMAS